jgi:hypothetical protein
MNKARMSDSGANQIERGTIVEEIKKYRSASIEVVANGFIIQIGCQRVVAETTDKLKKLINDYLDNPVEAEKKLFESSIVFGGSVAQDVVGRETVPTPTVQVRY